MTENSPVLVVLGVDVDGKPHASRFEERDAPFLPKAAEMMGFKLIRVEDGELRDVAERLAAGKIFATGRAFVPFCTRAVFEKLATLVEGGVAAITPRTPAAAPEPDPEIAQASDLLWSKIQLGTVLIACQPDEWEGWWECVVVGIEDDALMLRWRDEPKWPPFKVARNAVALLHPSAG